MRNRHLPRLCRNCQAPMAGHEDTCWRCGVEWASEETPQTTLRLIPAAAPSQAEHAPDRPIAVAVAARSTNEVRLDAERWTNEGGSFASEVGTRLAVSATAFGSAQDARRAAADVRLHAGSAEAAEGS